MIGGFRWVGKKKLDINPLNNRKKKKQSQERDFRLKGPRTWVVLSRDTVRCSINQPYKAFFGPFFFQIIILQK